MEKARADNLGITMLASPMGSNLYEKLGFKFCGTVVMQVPGEEERLEYAAMDWKSSDENCEGVGLVATRLERKVC